MVFKMTIAVATGLENNHLHQAIQWRYSEGENVAAAIPGHKADILG